MLKSQISILSFSLFFSLSLQHHYHSVFQEEDYGSYKCVAKNPRGETDGTIRLYSKCRLFTRILKYPAETFVKLMTNRGFLGRRDVIFIWIFVSGIFRLFPLFRCTIRAGAWLNVIFLFSLFPRSFFFFFFYSLPFAIKACSSTDGSIVLFAFLRMRARER